MTQEGLEERYVLRKLSAVDNAIPAESSSTPKPYEGFSCRLKRAVEQEVGKASGNNFLYLHAIFVYHPACCFWLEVWPTLFNRCRLNPTFVHLVT